MYGLSTEQKLTWERDGFIVIENLLEADAVTQINKKLDEAYRLWREMGSPNPETGQLNHVEQICGIIEYGDEFLELMEHPNIIAIMRDLLGDAFVMIDNDSLLKYPHQASHTNWHRDTDIVLSVGEKHRPLMVKAYHFLSDVPADGGCLAFLPGSVHMRNDDLPKVEVPEDMPGHVRMSVKAGTTVIFHGHIYHSALNNYSTATRRTVSFNYGQPLVRTWPGYEVSNALQENAQTPLRQMLFGMLPWMQNPKVFQDS